MSAATRGTKRRWLLSGTGAALAVATLLTLFRAPSPQAPVPAVRSARPPIRFSPGRPDELALRDLAPLFLPTPFNAPSAALQLREPGSEFFDQDAVKLKFAPAQLALDLPVPMQVPAGPVDALADISGPLALGIGRTSAGLAPLSPRGAHLDVYAAGSEESVFAIVLGLDARPALSAGERVSWSPIEFIGAVDAAGLVGPLVVTAGSGIAEVDQHFRNYLARTFRIGDRLPPGFYRIVVGP